MELTKRQKWFNSLPLRITAETGDRYERVCDVCGAAARYEYECPVLYEWINVHFQHGQALPPVPCDAPPTGEYNFNLPIKFSKAGFILFIEDFGLFAADFRGSTDPVQDEFDVYSDGKGNLYAFQKNYADNPVKDDYSDIFVMLDPYLTEIEC